MFFQDNFTQPDSSYNRTDNRTRLYYTAKFSDDFKFVNKFEFNSIGVTLMVVILVLTVIPLE